MKAIITKIIHATNFKPTRIKVQAEGVPHIVVSRSEVECQVGYGEEAIHQAAARRLCNKYDWNQRLVSGGLPTPGQWAHCFVEDEAPQANDRLVDCCKQVKNLEQTVEEAIADAAEWKAKAKDFERQLDRALR